MKLHKAIKYFRELCKQNNIPNIPIKLTNKKRILGMTFWNDYGLLRFELSKHYILSFPKEKLKYNFLHEIAHAIDIMRRGYTKHDKVWENICLEIGNDKIYDHLDITYFTAFSFCPTKDCPTYYFFFSIPKCQIKCKNCGNIHELRIRQ